MKGFIQISFVSLIPIAMMMYVLFNGYPSLSNSILVSGLYIAILLLLFRKEI